MKLTAFRMKKHQKLNLGLILLFFIRNIDIK